jgi:hypothetical protein
VVAELVGRVREGEGRGGDLLERVSTPTISSSVPPSGRSTRRLSSGRTVREDDPLAAAGADEGADGEAHAVVSSRGARKGLGLPDQVSRSSSRARVMAT